MADWEAEHSIDRPLVVALIGEQFPELAGASARLLAEGWDYSVWVVEERWAFRFPRRAVAIPGVERELSVLPRLAPHLPAPVPEPRFLGTPSERFPWPFFGATLFAGVEPAEAALDETDRAELGAELGRVLRVLHSAEVLSAVDSEGGLPVDLNRRSDMSVRLPWARENLAAIEAVGVWRVPAAVEIILAAAETLPAAPSQLTLAHGDLHQRNLLVDRGGLSAIIDWVDVCRADPCIDLVPFWSLLTQPGRERFLAEYGPVTYEQLLRARVLAIGLDSMLARYAHDVGNVTLERESVAGLERTVVDWD